jgi:chromosome partitioning protein
VEWVFVDTQPRSSAALSGMLRSVHFAIIPTKPNALDLGTLEQSLALVGVAGVPGCVVLTMCPNRAPEVAEIRESLRESSLPLCPVTLGERRLYARATASGRAVMEVEPHSLAAEEIGRLWKYVRKAMQ